MRECIKCGNDMSEGYIFDGSDTYCSDECLATKVSPEEWEILYEEDPSSFYWTVWPNDDGPSSDDSMEKHKGEVFDSFDNTTIDDMEDLEEEEEEEEDIDDFCPDLDEYGDIDTGRDPRGDYLDTDFT